MITMAKISVTLEVGLDGVGIITLSHPPVNALAFPGEFLLSRVDLPLSSVDL